MHQQRSSGALVKTSLLDQPASDDALVEERSAGLGYAYPRRKRLVKELCRRDDQHVAVRMMRDMVRHRPQHTPGAGHAPVADHDHLGATFLRNLDQRPSSLSWQEVSLAFDTEVSQSLLRSSDTFLGKRSLAAGFHRGGKVHVIAADYVNRRAKGACDDTSAVHRPLRSFGPIGPDDD